MADNPLSTDYSDKMLISQIYMRDRTLGFCGHDIDAKSLQNLIDFIRAYDRIKQLHRIPDVNTSEYREAPSGRGPHAAEWLDKPHRLIYDLCSEIERLRYQ